MTNPAQVRHDELAEITVRILIKLYRAYPDGAPISPEEVLRPGAQHTGPGDVVEVLKDLQLNWIKGGVVVDPGAPGNGVISDGDFELNRDARHLLDQSSSRKGKTWIEALRDLIDKPAPEETEADAFWGKLRDEL